MDQINDGIMGLKKETIMRKTNHCRWLTICPLRSFEKKGLLGKRWKTSYCESNWDQCMRYQNVVNGKHSPDQMLPDGSFINEN
jgi:hypothetical protein